MTNLDSRQTKKILSESKTIAVVGLSPDPERASHRVAAYMQKQGYRIIPVNPLVKDILGEKSYPSLLEIPRATQRTIDVVDIFRRAEEVNLIVEQAVKLHMMNGKPCIIWMQQGIVKEEAARVAENAGIAVVMDKCIMQEHKRLCRRASRRSRPATMTQ